jgi:oxygen-independent coproporphyrinogen-3 oxidase
VHIPFCRQLCWYCGCHTTIIHDYNRVSSYMETLRREVELLSRCLPGHGGLSHVHFGGGTPTLLSAEDFSAFVALLNERFGLNGDAELAVECDPRTVTQDYARQLADAGVNRISLGVQDFTPHVQQRINREQPVCTVANACKWFRNAGIEAINFDLMYGLPGQTAKSVQGSARLAANLNPNRVAVFGYAHVPWFKKHQRIFTDDELPDIEARFDQAEIMGDALREAGYLEIGFDHYARPDDSLARAAGEGRMARNFQGYTDDRADILLGLGASSIGSLADGYVQNAPTLDGYRDLVRSGRLPIVRGVTLSGDDRLRRAAIERILCDLELDTAALCRSLGHEIDALDDAFDGLLEMESDGLVALDGHTVTVRPSGRRFLRNIASCFDSYWRPMESRHSIAV